MEQTKKQDQPQQSVPKAVTEPTLKWSTVVQKWQEYKQPEQPVQK